MFFFFWCFLSCFLEVYLVGFDLDFFLHILTLLLSVLFEKQKRNTAEMLKVPSSVLYQESMFLFVCLKLHVVQTAVTLS